MLSIWSATIFFRSVFSFSSSFKRFASFISILPYLRRQRWYVALPMLCS